MARRALCLLSTATLLAVLGACGTEVVEDVDEGERGAFDAMDPFAENACPGAAQAVQATGQYRLAARERRCVNGSCGAWSPFALSGVPERALQGRLEAYRIGDYESRSHTGYQLCCGLHYDYFAGEYKTSCEFAFCTTTESVLVGHHPGLRLINSQGNMCDPWYWWATERNQRVNCSVNANGLRCDPYTYADGCQTKQLVLGGAPIRFDRGTVNSHCAQLAAINDVKDSDGSITEIESGLLVTF